MLAWNYRVHRWYDALDEHHAILRVILLCAFLLTITGMCGLCQMAGIVGNFAYLWFPMMGLMLASRFIHAFQLDGYIRH